MRIIGGKHRGRVLATFEGEAVRPTADRVKESLFNILSSRLYGARVLDLFCGSGSLGLEALSRGARQVVFNDAAKTSVAILKKNLQKLGEEASVTTFCHDYSLCLDLVQGKFDLIFLDPPYAMDAGEKALKKIAQKGLLEKDGVVVYERDRPFQGEIEGLEPFDERKYGKTYLTFFCRKE